MTVEFLFSAALATTKRPRLQSVAVCVLGIPALRFLQVIAEQSGGEQCLTDGIYRRNMRHSQPIKEPEKAC